MSAYLYLCRHMSTLKNGWPVPVLNESSVAETNSVFKQITMEDDVEGTNCVSLPHN